MAGNFQLHGWYLATDNYYLTDLPFYVLCGLLLGDRLSLIYLVPFFVFVMLLMACILIVRCAGKTAWWRDVSTLTILVLIGFPFAAPQMMLLQSGVHGTTMMLALYGFFFAQCLLTAARPNRFLLVPFGVIVFLLAGSDPQADAYFIAPLILVMLFRAWQYARFQPDEWLLAGTAVLATGLGIGFIDYITRHGGFYWGTNYSLGLVASAQGIVDNLHAVLRAIQMLFDARASVLEPLHLFRLIAFSRFVTLIIVAVLCLRVVWRAPRDAQSVIPQWLVLGVLWLAGLDAMSGMFATILSGRPDHPTFAIRYVFPAYILMSLAAVMEAQSLSATRIATRARYFGAGALLSALFLFAALQVGWQSAQAKTSIVAAPQYPLALWLMRHGLQYGVGDYWTTQMITALSQGRVVADPVTAPGGRLVPFSWNDDMSNMQAGRRPQFVVFARKNDFNVDLTTIRATYQQPQDIATVGDYVVVILK